MKANNKALKDLRRYAKHLDSLAQALDAPRGPDRIRLARKEFARLTAAMHRDVERRGNFPKQISLFNFMGPS